MTAGLFVRLVTAIDRLAGVDLYAEEPEPCPSCDGAGRVANDDTDSDLTPMWRDCATCDGTGVAPVPDEHDESRPADIDECGSCGGDGLVTVIDWMCSGSPIDTTCPGCGGTGERGAA